MKTRLTIAAIHNTATSFLHLAYSDLVNQKNWLHLCPSVFHRWLVIVLLVPATLSAEPATSKPNVVVFLADDMGWGDSATYGHELIQTPNLDKLASQGVKFTQCYSACGVCSPSRSAILTGRTPYRNGVYRHLSGNHEAHLRTSEIGFLMSGRKSNPKAPTTGGRARVKNPSEAER